MKVNGLILLYLIIFGSALRAQEVLFLGEGRQDEVRLFWIPKKHWPQGTEGFYIKRKSDIENNWKQLNSSMIVPGTNQDKALNNLGLTTTSAEHLRKKRDTLIAAGTLTEIPSEKLIDFMKDERMLQGIAVMVNSDFDIALISGFGYVDRNIPKANHYTYGLFPVIDGSQSETPVSTFQWQYGTTPKLEVTMEGRVKSASAKKKTVELIWMVNTEDYRSYQTLNGFNIYRKSSDTGFVKLNQSPLWISLKEKQSTLYFKDENVDLNKKQVYAAAPNTIFNTAGNYAEIEVEVRETPETMKPPVQGGPEKNGDTLLLNWTFPQEQQAYIKGFHVQLESKENVFKNISDLLPPDTRVFSYDGLPEPDNGYYHFKIIALKNDGLELWSNRKIFYNKINTRPSAPKNLKAEVITSETAVKIKLTWQPPVRNSSFVKEYYVYTSSPNQDKVVKEGSIDSITEEAYLFPVHRDRAATYSFAVSAVNEQNEESPLSEKISILVPSTSLPFIDLWPLGKEGNQITLNWEYDGDIADLAGFRLFQNNELIADESLLTAETHQWKSGQLQAGQYSYEIIAVTFTNVQSERSEARKFRIE